jgi:hypothetical protein
MKTLSRMLPVALLAALLACSFSAGTKTDLKTGLSYTYNGFTLDEVYFVDSDNQPLSSNEVALGSTVALVAQGIGNFELENNKAFPGLSLEVIGKDGEQVLAWEDLLKETEGYSAEEASVLRGALTVGSPLEAEKQYTLRVTIWDKKRPENKIVAQVPLHVVSLAE